MSTDCQSTRRRRNIAENFNWLCGAHERYRQTDRRTDGRTGGRPTTYSERERLNVSSSSLKINNGDSRTAGGRVHCSSLVGVTLNCPLRKKSATRAMRPFVKIFDHLFHFNSPLQQMGQCKLLTYKFPLPLTDPRDAVPQAHSVVHRCRRSV